MIPGHYGLQGDRQCQHEGARAAAQARRTSCEDPQIQQGPVQKALLQLWTGGPAQNRRRTRATTGAVASGGFPGPRNDPVARAGAGGSPRLDFIGTDGTGGVLEDGNLLPAGLLSLHHHTWGTK